jgi:hypothetical protein
LEVDSVFVPLFLELGGRRQHFSSSSFLSAGKRLIIAGDPGSGKTSMIKRVFREQCRRAIANPDKKLLPIRLELKTLTPPDDLANDEAAGDWLLQSIRDLASKVEGFEMDRLFDALVRTSGILVLLDGLDEVSGERYPAIASSLRGLSQRLALLSTKNQIVITTRIQFLQQVGADLQNDYPQTLYIESFTPNEIYLFLTLWPFGTDAEENISRIYRNLTDRPTLREMCSNPLVLAMYVHSDQESDSREIPETRTEFYSKVVGELLVMRRRRQEIVAGKSISLRDQREAILGKLAFENLCDSRQAANTLSWSRAIEVGAKVWDCSSEEAEKNLRRLASETGIISEERPGETFRFIHLTFCEFLAAIECAQGLENGWEALLVRHRSFIRSQDPALQSRLIEVIPFAHALLPRVKRSATLRQVAELGDRLVLGRCFLETQQYGHIEWGQYLIRESTYLGETSEEDWDEARIRRLHLFSVVVHDGQVWTESIGKRKSIVDLTKIFAHVISGNRSTVKKVFAAYVTQDAAAAFNLAERVGVDLLAESPELLIESCKENAFLALAMRKVDENSENSRQWMYIVTEAALRYVVVARHLWSTASTGGWQLANGHPVPRMQRITRAAALLPGTYYASLLKAVYSKDAPVFSGLNRKDYPSIYSASRMFKRNRLSSLLYVGTRQIWLACMAAFAGSITIAFLAESVVATSFALLGAMLAVQIFFIFMQYNIHYIDLHSAILNVSRTPLAAPPLFSRGGPLGKRLLRAQRWALAEILRRRPGNGSSHDKSLVRGRHRMQRGGEAESDGSTEIFRI